MRVVIVEDDLILLDAVARALPLLGVEVVGRAGDEPGALKVIAETLPDVAMLDIRLPPTKTDEGLRIAERVRALHPGVGLLVVSANSEVAFARRLLDVEADPAGVGYVLKDQVSDLAELADTLARVAAGGIVLDRGIVVRLAKRHRDPDPLPTLTPTERRVLELMAEGYSNAGIGEKLRLRLPNVEKYVSAVTGKLGLPSREDPKRRGLNVRVLAVLEFLRGGHGTTSSGGG
jgi:DNA-binding NarL/FixJ family response regulator